MRRLCLVGLVLLVLAPRAFGWAELGHQLVGALAERMLTPAARAEVRALLADEPTPTLAGVAYWADALRGADPERFAATSRWHYVAMTPGSCGYEAAQSCPNGECVVEAIRAQVKVLGDRAQPRAARIDALKFLVHLVGDVHQPLHASDRPDRGGNGFELTLRTAIPPEAYARAQYHDGIMQTNLHAVWDYYVLASAGRTLKAYARRLRVRRPASVDAATVDPAAWASESCRLIDAKALYPDSHALTHAYLKSMRPLAERRVARAAQRLAQLLNGTLPPAATAPAH